MNVHDVRARISGIAGIAESPGDDQVAHGMEDRLWSDVLEAIANGTCDDPKACAAEALKTIDIHFARWCA